MKMIKNKKRLNNKGFTLIELLAVIVILAVVMGVATTSVLSAMNNSRKSSLQNSALSAADAFRTAYSEMSITNGKNDLLGLGETATTSLLGGTAQNLTDAVGKKLNITIAADGTSANYTTESFVYFDTTNNSFIVCLVANKAGSYYVAAVANNAPASAKFPTNNGKQVAAKKMWACSDNSKGWTN